MRIRKPEFSKFRTGNAEAKFNNEFVNHEWKTVCQFKFYEINNNENHFSEILEQFDSEKLETIGCRVNSLDDKIEYYNHGYSYSLRLSFILHHVNIESIYKLPQIECYIHQLLTLIKTTPLPSFDLDDFFVDEEKGVIDAFGNVCYFLDITRPSSRFFYKNETIPTATIEDVKKVIFDIASVIGTGENGFYKDFYEFMNRLRTMTSMDQIWNDKFYETIGKRRERIFPFPQNLPPNDGNNFLGEGSFGIVYKHIFQIDGLNQEVAMKFTYYKQMSKSVSEKRLNKREYNVGLAIKGFPSVISFIGKTIKQQMYSSEEIIIMNICPNDLDKYIKEQLQNHKNKQTMIEIAFFDSIIQMIDVLTGALSLISIGVVHRDYKAENILMNNRRCFVSDFGTSLAISESNYARTVFGSPLNFPRDYYDQDLDKSANDIYALGLVLSCFYLQKPLAESVNTTKVFIGDQVCELLRKFTCTNERIQTFSNEFIPKIIHMLDDSINKRATWYNVAIIREFLINELKKDNYNYLPIDDKYNFVTWIDVFKKIMLWINEKAKQGIIPYVCGMYELKQDVTCKDCVQKMITVLNALLFYTSDNDMKEEYKQIYRFMHEIYAYHLVWFNEETSLGSFFQTAYLRYVELI